MAGMNPSLGVAAASIDDVTALRRYARHGDPEAFEVLTARYGAMVLATCMRRLPSRDDAEDAAQETFLRLARQASRVRSNVAAWLHACAVGASVDIVRRNAARGRIETRSARAAGEAFEADDATVLWRDLEPIIDNALAELSAEDRHLLVARFLAQRPQVELARDLGVSEGTLSRRVSRALERLRAKLASSGLAIAGVGVLAAALGQGSSAGGALAAPLGLGKIALAGLAAPEGGAAVALGVVGWSVGLVSAGAAVIVGALLIVPSRGGASPSVPSPALVRAYSADQVARGPARPRGTLGTFQTISAYDEDFNESGTFITDDGVAIRRGVDAVSGKPRRIRLEIRQTRAVEDDPKTSALREVAEVDAFTSRVLPESDEWARFSRGQNLTLKIAFDQFGRIVIREKDDLVQIGKNEPAWYGVRPPPGWAQRDEIPENAGPLGILGPWTESERIPVTISGEEIRFGPEGWNAGRYRVIEWEQEDGFSRVLSVQAGGRNPRLIGSRFKLIIREIEGGYEIAYYPPSSGRGDRWPSSFEFSMDNPIRLVRLGGER